MKNFTLDEFMLSIPIILTNVTDHGNMVRVQTQDHGAFVIMDEATYQTIISKDHDNI